MNNWWKYQSENLFWFVPFLMAFGAALYFTMPAEPYIIGLPIITLCLITIMFWNKIPNIIRGITLLCFGFCYACIYTNLVSTPKLKYDLHDHNINAVVESIDYTPDSKRLYLSVRASDIRAGNGMARVRVKIGDDIIVPNVGDNISATVGLFGMSPAPAPETFDWARHTYFNNLTATGYVTDLKIINHANSVNLREFIHHKSESFLVDSLVLGYKNMVPEKDDVIWTSAGVGHIWSISGFHMTLLGGWLFVVFFFIFRSIPYITRRIPAKSPALICAWVGLLFYMCLSGADTATFRAFCMTTLVFAAFIFGRSAISMRNVALVFILMFLINPHYVMQAGFQLSFAAVFGLVWMYDVVKPKMPHNKILKITYASVLTSVWAGIFTAPFVAMHFGTIPTYSIMGNLILLPIFSVTIMPLVIIGALLSVFGILFPLNWAHQIYDMAFQIANWIAQLPMSVIDVPHISNAAIMCFILGLISLIVITPYRIRLNIILCIVFCMSGAICVATTPKPIFYTTHDNELVGFIDDNGKLEFNKSRASNHFFAFNTWKELNNEAIDTPNPRRKHDNGVYRYNNIIYIQKFVPLMNNLQKLCNDESVDYIVSYWNIDSEKCAHKILRGGFIMYPNGRIKYTPANRPWH